MLRKLIASGVTPRLIAQKLKRSIGAIQSRIFFFKKPRKRLTVKLFDLKGKKLFDLKGVNIYGLSGDLVGHLADVHGAEKRLDKSTDRLFPTSS
jgi:hypothetical protein